jgi:hypothetical protein
MQPRHGMDNSTPTADTSLLALSNILGSIGSSIPAHGSAPVALVPAPAAELEARSENSTDASRGEPIVIRAMKRKAELEAALTLLPVEDTLARNDIEHVLGSFESLLTGDLKALSSLTASDLSRLLEINKHLAETTPQAKASPLTLVPDPIDASE